MRGGWRQPGSLRPRSWQESLSPWNLSGPQQGRHGRRPGQVRPHCLPAAVVLVLQAARSCIRSADGGLSRGRLSSGAFIDTAPDGTVFLADYGNNRIKKLSADGEFIAEWGSAGDGPFGFDNPHGIDVGPDGLVYLADFRNDQVKVFDQDGTHVATWGDRSDPDGIELLGAVGIAVGDDGSVYVSEYWARDVEKLIIGRSSIV